MIRKATESHRPLVERLLHEADLPVASVDRYFARYWVAESGDALAGAIGSEDHGAYALLRSAVVAPRFRGTGIGTALAEVVVEQARDEGRAALFLLTTTAEAFFPRLGFRVVTRDDVPEVLYSSPEFQGACPASAIVMRLDLQ